MLVLYALAIVAGDLNQDEGWYLYAGRLAHEGLHPFRDFASTQGPLMAYVYALAYPLIEAWGVVGGRLFTALMGVLGILLAARLAARLAETVGERGAGDSAALLAVGLLGLNLYHVYFTSLVKTYGLAGLLTVLGFLALERALRAADRSAGGRLAAFGAGSLAAGCFALAAGTRLSAGILLPAVWLPLAAVWWRGGGQWNGLAAVLAGMLIGGGAMLTAVYLPFLLTAPSALSFGLLEYHAGRQVGGVPLLLAYKAGFVLRLSASYFPVLVIGALGLAGWVVAGRGAVPAVPPPRLSLPRRCLPLAMAGGAAGVTAIHLAAPFPYDDYQVFVMPCIVLLAVVPAAVRWRRLVPSDGRRAVLLAGALFLMMVHSASSPLLQAWVTAGRDRIWWPLRTETPLQGLRRAAAAIPGAGAGVLLTQDTYLAVEAGMRVPPGMELGPFCFFPDLDDETAGRHRVLNESLLSALMHGGTYPVAAVSGYGMAIRAPHILPVEEAMKRRLEDALHSRYELVGQMESFGQGDTTLRIYKRRTEP